MPIVQIRSRNGDTTDRCGRVVNLNEERDHFHAEQWMLPEVLEGQHGLGLVQKP